MEYIKNFNIVVSFDSKYLKMAETMIVSLLKNNGMNMHIYLLYSSLKEDEIEEVRKLIKKFKDNVELIPIYIDKDKYKKFFTTEAFPIEACYRLIIQDVLPKEEKRALWLDSDLIVRGPLFEFYTQHFNGNYAVACDDISMISGEAIQNLKRLGLSEDGVYFNSGVLLLNLEEIRKNINIGQYFKFMEKNKDKLYYPDQDTINVLYKGKIKHNFSYEYNLYFTSCLPIEDKRDIKKIKRYANVFHYPGLINKPTNYEFYNFGFDEFWKYGKYAYGMKKYIEINLQNKIFRLKNITGIKRRKDG